MSKARCVGRSWLFLSTDQADHELAKIACLGQGDEGKCPLFDACEKARLDFLTTQWRSGLHGTWAGELYGRRIRTDGKYQRRVKADK